MKTFAEHQIIEASKTDCMRKFEKVLFGSISNSEKDTNQESYILSKVRDWLSADSHKHVDIVKSFKELQDCKQYFKTLLVPTNKVVWRGHIVSWHSIRQFTGKIHTSNLKIPSYDSANGVKTTETIYINEYYTPQGNHGVQSWTTSRNIAKTFAGDMIKFDSDRTVGVIMEAKVNSDFIMTPKFMNQIGKKYWKRSNGTHGESEIVRVSKTPIKVKMHISKQAYERITA